MDVEDRVIIMRGVSGSGKSTAAKWLASNNTTISWKEDCVTYFGSVVSHKSPDFYSGRTYLIGGDYCLIKSAIHSTDEYFMVDGEYKFDGSKLGRNHSNNYKAFLKSVEAGIPLIIIDNTNTTRKEWSKYENHAISSGYWVSYHVLPHPSISEAEKRNTHGVPADVINKMIQRFQ